MDNQELDILLENLSLKFEFDIRQLDLSQVFYPEPDDLLRENRVLRQLLDWVEKYSEYGDRSLMELAGYRFPPIEPDISPDSDWYRFERWLEGRPIRQTLEAQLPFFCTPKDPGQLSDEELISELQRLSDYLLNIGVVVEFLDDVPPRLVYEQLLEIIATEEFDIIGEGFWHLDGCTGCCPGCFQRPWCDTGGQLCWPEDEEAGEMFLIEPVKRYVSASPMSLLLLQKNQAEEDRMLEQFRQNRPDTPDILIDPWPFEVDDDEIPF